MGHHLYRLPLSSVRCVLAVSPPHYPLSAVRIFLLSSLSVDNFIDPWPYTPSYAGHLDTLVTLQATECGICPVCQLLLGYRRKHDRY